MRKRGRERRKRSGGGKNEIFKGTFRKQVALHQLVCDASFVGYCVGEGAFLRAQEGVGKKEQGRAHPPALASGAFFQEILGHE